MGGDSVRQCLLPYIETQSQSNLKLNPFSDGEKLDRDDGYDDEEMLKMAIAMSLEE